MSIRYFLLLIIGFSCLSTYGMQRKRFLPGIVYARSLELREAICSGSCSAVSDLLNRGANINMVYDHGGLTPLLLAIWRNDLPMVRFLHEQGADLNMPDGDGRTPLICATLWGRCEIINYLFDNKVDYTQCDQFGRSAWGIVIERGDVAVARVFARDYIKHENPFMYRADRAFAQHSGEIQLLK